MGNVVLFMGMRIDRPEITSLLGNHLGDAAQQPGSSVALDTNTNSIVIIRQVCPDNLDQAVRR